MTEFIAALRQSLLFLCLTAVTTYWGMASDGIVEGRLRDPLGQPGQNAKLIVVNLDTGTEVVVFTDNRGLFSVQLAQGDYAIYLNDSGGRSLLRELILDDGEERMVELEVPVPSGQSLEAIREFEIGLSRVDLSSSSGELFDLINPFPSRNKGLLYGSVYAFHRNDNLDARNFFDEVGEPLPEFKRNQFGVTLGSIVSPDLSFQGTLEGLRIVQGSTLVSHIPTIKQRTGDFSALETVLIDPFTRQPFDGNRIPQERIDTIANRLLAFLPDPNRADPDRNFVNNDPRVEDQDFFSIRSDYSPDDHSKLVVDYRFTDGERTDVDPIPGFNRISSNRNQAVSLSYDRSLSERLIAVFRFNFDRNVNLRLSENSNRSGLLDSIGIGGVSIQDSVEEGVPEFNLTGYAGFGDDNSPTTSVRNGFELEANFTYVVGGHTLRSGVELNRQQINNDRSGGLRRGRFVFSGVFTGDAFADFLLGFPDQATRAVGSDRVDLRRSRWEVFFRDEWKITPNFTFSFGFNYNYTPPFHSINNRVSTLFPLLFELPPGAEVVVAGSERAGALGFDGAVDGSLIFADTNDWAPRLGFAWNPLGNNRVVLRGSYNIRYRSPGDREFIRALGRNFPFYVIEIAESSEDNPELALSSPFDSASPTELNFRAIDPNFKNGYIQDWELSLQSEVRQNWNLDISYEGDLGIGMTRVLPGNVPLPGPGLIQTRRPNPAFGRVDIVGAGGTSSGHELNVTLERRLSDGFSFRSGFEWSRSFDDSFRDPSNPRDLKAERAQSSFRPRRRLFFNYIVDLPFGPGRLFNWGPRWFQKVIEGWRLSGITNFEDGRPFSVRLSGDPNNDGVRGDRPNRIGSGLLPASERSVDQYFDTGAFVAPPPFAFGDAGRNILLAPGSRNWDISLIKRTQIRDSQILELRVQLFNAFNHTNFNRPNTTLGTSVFGQIFGARRAREIEIALKYTF